MIPSMTCQNIKGLRLDFESLSAELRCDAIKAKTWMSEV